jgi:predicted component of type VI protein secretion system
VKETVMKARLIVISGRHCGQGISICHSPFLIGRDPSAHLRPASSAVSPRHCAIIITEDIVLVQDFASGTRLNNRSVEGAAELADGDCLQIGPLAFRVALDHDSATHEPMPAALSGSEAAEDELVATMLLSMPDNTSRATATQNHAAPAMPPAIDGWGGDTAPVPAAHSELAGTALSARNILKMYRKALKGNAPQLVR